MLSKVKEILHKCKQASGSQLFIADHLAKLAKFKEQEYYTFRHRILTDNIGMMKRI
jgi:hypothetical protein